MYPYLVDTDTKIIKYRINKILKLKNKKEYHVSTDNKKQRQPCSGCLVYKKPHR